jgi:hypothetical protein
VINIGIIVDLQKNTVVGLEPTVPLTIDFLAETTLSFSRAETDWQMSGTLDRIPARSSRLRSDQTRT